MIDPLRCPRPSCTCTSRARWSRSWCSSWPGATASRLPFPPRRRSGGPTSSTTCSRSSTSTTAAAAVLLTERGLLRPHRGLPRRARADGVRHAEIFFDPQTHTERGVAFETVIERHRGRCASRAPGVGITSRLILCFLRHSRPRTTPWRRWRQRCRFGTGSSAVGLDSSEVGHPPQKFARVFARAAARASAPSPTPARRGRPSTSGRRSTSCGVGRIDHGVRCLEDPRAGRAAGRPSGCR